MSKRDVRVLDLREDFKSIYRFLKRRLRQFDPKTKNGPGGSGAVRRIDVGYGFEQSGWVAIVFDTRPDAEPDGEWNDFIDGNDLKRTHWPRAHNSNEHNDLHFIMLNGGKKVLPPGSCAKLSKAIGELLKAVLLKARADGLFVGLTKAKGCELGVEEQNGSFGWSAYA